VESRRTALPSQPICPVHFAIVNFQSLIERCVSVRGALPDFYRANDGAAVTDYATSALIAAGRSRNPFQV
jgi:hypothetical protein